MLFEDINVKNLEEKYEQWQRAFVNGTQFTYFNEYSGSVMEEDRIYYWQSYETHNIIYKYVKEWESKNYKNIYGKNNVVDQLIPLQRHYNKTMNQIMDVTHRIVYPILAVEDGSVDTDELGEEGLLPGKVLIYRQGAKAPTTLPQVNNDVILTLWSFANAIKNEIIEIAESFERINKREG